MQAQRPVGPDAEARALFELIQFIQLFQFIQFIHFILLILLILLIILEVRRHERSSPLLSFLVSSAHFLVSIRDELLQARSEA